MSTALKQLEGWDIALLRKIKSSIFIKIFISIAFILTLTSLFIYIIAMMATPQSYQAERKERFSESIIELADQLQTVARKDAENIIINFCIENRATVSLENNNESLIFGDLTAFKQEENKTENDKVSFSFKTYMKFLDSDIAYSLSAVPVDKVVNEITAAFERQIPWIIITIAIISIIGSFICSRILAKPVLELSRISKRMSTLDMTWHCDINRTDELGVLAKSLNTMAQKLNATMIELETANHQLEIDIEKERIQEKQRRTFFAAVSHELKTPITIIMGQIESMIYNVGDYKNRDKYLPLAFKTVERMENLVKEILTISRLTADDFQITKRPTNLNELIQECLNIYKPLSLKKNIYLEYNYLENITLAVDKKLFEKVLSNIISNAILYSPPEEKVTVKLSHKGLWVENTGVHIPEDKMSDLFAPLTLVEESRNKKSGGSGLGLYLVKTILDLHQLPCNVQNTERGVIFTILFNLNQN